MRSSMLSIFKKNPLLSRLAFIIGLLLLAGYWYSVHPPGFARGYSEDIGNHEMARQLMSEQLALHGKPGFFSDQVMAPSGMSLPFYAGWNIERDWVGGYVWSWNREFPFEWVYYGLSLLFCYLSVGLILKKMGFASALAWALALFVSAFNLPRHMKLWHHADTVMVHWLYAGFFLDAWIWQRFVKLHRWAIHLELWRIFLLLGVFCTLGYNWGPDIMMWEITRVSMLGVWFFGKRSGLKIRVDRHRREFILPITLCLILFSIQLRWFIPLFSEAMKFGTVPQGHSWFAHLLFVIRPLWFEGILRWTGTPAPFLPFETPETVVTVGWSYILPFFLALLAVRKKNGGSGWVTIAPFLVMIVIACLYFGIAAGHHFPATLVSMIFPFMKFFRVTSRFGIILPPLFMAVIVLAMPDLKKRRWGRIGVALFAAIVLIESSFLAYPVNAFPPFPQEARTMLEKIRDLPGTTVLTLPFCVAGANGYCTNEQCPAYPMETFTHATRLFHDKKVYGSYTSRMRSEDCQIYRRDPYESWFAAWRTHQCFSPAEWTKFCNYLASHSELSALLIFPDLWTRERTPECEKDFMKYLGAPTAEATVPSVASRSETPMEVIRMRWYQPRCLNGS